MYLSDRIAGEQVLLLSGVEMETVVWGGIGVKVIGFREMDGEGGATYYGFTGQFSVQSGAKNSCMFEFPMFLLPTNLGQPIHSLSAMTELPSPNLAVTFLLYPVYNGTGTTFVLPGR